MLRTLSMLLIALFAITVGMFWDSHDARIKEYENLAFKSFESNDYAKAARYYQKIAYLSAKKHVKSHELISLFLEIAKCYSFQEDYKVAIKYLERAERLIIRDGDARWLHPLVIDRLTANYIKAGYYSKALSRLTSAYNTKKLKLNKKNIHEIMQLAEIVIQISIIYDNLGNCYSALKHIKRALKLLDRITPKELANSSPEVRRDFAFLQTQAFACAGNFYLALGFPNKADLKYAKAVKVIDKLAHKFFDKKSNFWMYSKLFEFIHNFYTNLDVKAPFLAALPLKQQLQSAIIIAKICESNNNATAANEYVKRFLKLAKNSQYQDLMLPAEDFIEEDVPSHRKKLIYNIFMAITCTDKSKQEKAYRRFAKFYLARDEIDSAAKYYIKAFRYYSNVRRCFDRTSVALLNLAKAYHKLRQSAKVRFYFYQALKFIFDEKYHPELYSNELVKQLSATDILNLINEHGGNSNSAILNYCSEILFRLAVYSIEDGDYKEALRYLEKNLYLAEPLNNIRMLIQSYAWYSLAARKCGDLQKALSSGLQALSLKLNYSQKDIRTVLLAVNVSVVYSCLNESALASSYFAEAKLIAQDIPQKERDQLAILEYAFKWNNFSANFGLDFTPERPDVFWALQLTDIELLEDRKWPQQSSLRW